MQSAFRLLCSKIWKFTKAHAAELAIALLFLALAFIPMFSTARAQSNCSVFPSQVTCKLGCPSSQGVCKELDSGIWGCCPPSVCSRNFGSMLANTCAALATLNK